MPTFFVSAIVPSLLQLPPPVQVATPSIVHTAPAFDPPTQVPLVERLMSRTQIPARAPSESADDAPVAARLGLLYTEVICGVVRLSVYDALVPLALSPFRSR